MNLVFKNIAAVPKKMISVIQTENESITKLY